MYALVPQHNSVKGFYCRAIYFCNQDLTLSWTMESLLPSLLLALSMSMFSQHLNRNHLKSCLFCVRLGWLEMLTMHLGPSIRLEFSVARETHTWPSVLYLWNSRVFIYYFHCIASIISYMHTMKCDYIHPSFPPWALAKSPHLQYIPHTASNFITLSFCFVSLRQGFPVYP